MPYQQPDRSSMHVDRPLTNLSVAYMNDQRDYVASRFAPLITVDKDSDKYFVYEKEFWFRNSMKKRAMSVEAAVGGWELGTADYSCENYSLKKLLDDRLPGNADSPINVERDATEWLTAQALLNLELVFAATYFTTGVWTTDQTGVAGAPGGNQFLQFNDLNSRPIETLRSGMRVVKKRTGKRPNKLLLGREVFDVLIDHPDIVGRFDRGQTSGPAVANEQTISALLGLKEVLVMDAVKETAAEGVASSMDWIGGKAMLLGYVEESPGVLKPSAAYTFASTTLGGSSQMGTRIKRYRDEPRRSNVVEIDALFDCKKVAADLGLFYTAAIA